MSVNKVILVGNLGKDPEVRYLDSGTPVATLAVATNESYKNKNGEKVTNTEWHNVVLWRGQAEVAEKFLKKGDLIYIEGKLRTRSWDDKEGNKRYATEVVADTFTMLGKKSNSENQAQATTNEPIATNEPDNLEQETDDLPF